MSHLSPIFARLEEGRTEGLLRPYPFGMGLDPGVLKKRTGVEYPSSEEDRTHLVQSLLKENKLYGSDPVVTKNIQKLLKPETRVVITGQQPGLLGGSLLVLHKALTAIALAEKYTSELGCAVVPVFWIAGDDSDLAECNFAEDLLRNQRHALNFSDADKPLPLHQRGLDQALLKQLQELENNFSFDFPRLREGQSLADAFGSFLHSLLGSKGLIIVNAGRELVKAHSQTILKGFIQQRQQISRLLEDAEKQNKQIGIQNNIPLYDENTPRCFKYKDGLRERLTAQEVNASTDHELSHDVLSRPLVCDSLFPVLTHVLGPAEMNYFALLRPLYDLFHIPFPITYPRCHGTWLPAELKAVIKNLDITFQDVLEKSIHDILCLRGKKVFSELELEEEIFSINPAMLNAVQEGKLDSTQLESWNNKIKALNHVYSKKVFVKLGRSDSEYYNNLHEVKRFLGNNRKQERVLLIANLLEKTNLQNVFERLSPLDRQHQYIDIEECDV